MRQQLAVHSPLHVPTFARAALAAAVGSGPTATATSRIKALTDADRAILMDSGTSALVAALRAAVGQGGTVAFPGFACVDLAAAAELARVRVRLYDLDPNTLSPDLDSVRAVFRRGVRAIVVAHLYGYAADMTAIMELASEYGAHVIEDAAQGAGGTLHGRRLGSFGELSILSFGRGKGMTAGAGGALVARDAGVELAEKIPPLRSGGRGLTVLLSTLAQYTLGRPRLYAIPSALPFLHLGEMVYHPAHEPRSITAASAALLMGALRIDAEAVEIRRANAAMMIEALGERSSLVVPRPIADSQPGYLRLPLLDPTGRGELRSRGLLRAYPLTMYEMSQLQPLLAPDEREQPGALTLRRTLLTAPTHVFVRDDDIRAIADWTREQLPRPHLALDVEARA